MDNINWDDLRFFIALVETETVSAAAKRLNVNYATVSRRVERLETAIRQKLFDRTLSGYQPTVEGLVLYHKTNHIREQIQGLESDFFPENQFRKPVVVSMVSFLAEYLVIDGLKPLCKKSPDLRLEVDITSRNVSLMKKEADIALRLNLPESGESLCRKIGQLDYVLYSNAYWLERLLSGREVHLVTYTSELAHLPEARYLLERFGHQSVRFQSDSVTTQKIAAEKGYGIALLPQICIPQGVNAPAAQKSILSRDVWMLSSKLSSQSAPVRLVMTELAQLFAGSRTDQATE
ncbi:LysR family transcriptional regulator [Vibrio quintilis]|uniref:DNA-binding transcriptional regulator LysR n=1 Tax=Vibrio quintilis TaxID=1117707 RepID=A0A1M7Z0A6_9VIBR|nr:LysR family transcriptional regulator [Vibrio quintilis]SHO58253.1 DNA-binding transcriptional regulator LysR [Vibrio quintilis]